MKSTIIKNLAQIVCKVKELKFGIHQFNLDLFSPEQFFAPYPKSDDFKLTILEQLIAKCISNS